MTKLLGIVGRNDTPGGAVSAVGRHARRLHPRPALRKQIGCESRFRRPLPDYKSDYGTDPDIAGTLANLGQAIGVARNGFRAGVGAAIRRPPNLCKAAVFRK